MLNRLFIKFSATKAAIILLLNDTGPWGPRNGEPAIPKITRPQENGSGNSSGNSGNGSGKDPSEDKKNSDKNSKNNSPQPPKSPWESYNNRENQANQKKEPFPDFAQAFKNRFKNQRQFFDKAFGGGGNFRGSSGDSNFSNPPKSTWGLIVLTVVLVWLGSGFYKINPDENGVVLYFGKLHAVTTPGLNYHLPFPIGKLIKKSVTLVNTEEFGFALAKHKTNRDMGAESLMLTGDENIVDIDFQVQWQVSDIKDFVFNLTDQNLTIRKSAESAMREIIARTPIVSALSDGKGKIEQETRDLLQEILDSYGAGVKVTLVQLLRVDPPEQVIDAFRDVQTAKADREKEINQAKSYANDIVPRARGTASQTFEQAEAYKQEVIANATGQAERFLSIYNQYVKAKQVTKKRMYIEKMTKLYRDMDKVIIDQNAAKSSVVPYLPLNDFKSTPKPNIQTSKPTVVIEPAAPVAAQPNPVQYHLKQS